MRAFQRLLAGLLLPALLLSGAAATMAADSAVPVPGNDPLGQVFRPVLGQNPIDGWYGGFKFTLPKWKEKGLGFTFGGRYGFDSHDVTGMVTLDRFLDDGRRFGLGYWDLVTYRGMYSTEPLWTGNRVFRLSAQRPLSGILTLNSVLTRTEITEVDYPGTEPVDGGVTTAWRTTLSARPAPEAAGYLAWDHGLNWFDGRYRYDTVETGGMRSVAIDANQNLTFYGRAAAITGDYPVQSSLTLGDQRFLLDQNLGDSFWGGIGNAEPGSPMTNPSNLPYLRGYDSNAFRGDRLYVVNIEYARAIFPDLIGDLVRFESVCFLDAGNTWFQGNTPGPVKTSAGLSLRLQAPLGHETWDMGDYLNHTGMTLSMDLARGLSAGGDWKLGLSAGLSYLY